VDVEKSISESGRLSSLSPLTLRKRLYVWRKKMRPITGRKYLLLAKLEFARSVSAPVHRRFPLRIVPYRKIDQCR
jgi:hypothetical protein